jgi:hypothetical protein
MINDIYAESAESTKRLNPAIKYFPWAVGPDSDLLMLHGSAVSRGYLFGFLIGIATAGLAASSHRK